MLATYACSDFGFRMNWLCAIQVALRALRAHKLRTSLNVLGMMVGVAAVITSTAIGAGAQAEVEEQIESLGTRLIIIYPGSFTAAGVRLGSGTRASLTDDDAIAIQSEALNVEAAAPALQGRGQVVFGSSNWSTGYYGVTPDFFDVRRWKVANGELFDASHVATAAKVVLLGGTVARNLFGDIDPVGHVVRVGKVPMTVLGVLAPKGQTLQAQDQDDTLLMPITTLRNRIVGGSRAKLRLLNSISVKIHPEAEMAEARADISDLLRQRHRLQPGASDDFTLRDLTEVISRRDEAARSMTLLLTTIGIVSLLVGGVGILNMMLASVTERTVEIGLRMAVGARRRDILFQFLVEAMTIAIFGGVCGCVLGLGAILVISQVAGWRAHIDVETITWAIGMAGAVGVFAGVYPARKASLLAPIVALRM